MDVDHQESQTRIRADSEAALLKYPETDQDAGTASIKEHPTEAPRDVCFVGTINLLEDSTDNQNEPLLGSNGNTKTGPDGLPKIGRCRRLKNYLEKDAWTMGKVWCRRAFHLAMFWIILLLTFVLLSVLIGQASVNEEYSFSGNKLKIETSACRILLKHGSNSDVVAHINSKIQGDPFNSTSSSTSEYFDTSDTYLKMLNPVNDVDSWDIELESSSYPELEIICKEFECPITQDDDDIKINGRLQITHHDEGDGNVYLKRIDVTDLYINITGTLSIEQLTAQNGGLVYAQRGDVWIQSQQQAEVNWMTNYSSAFQFVAPSAYHIEEPQCDRANVTITNTTYLVNNCYGISATWLDAGCATDYSLDLTALDGGVYVQLLKEPEELWDTNMISWRDYDSLISQDMDLISKQKISEIVDKTNGDVVEDMFVMMTMAGVNAELGRWLFTTKEAYTQLKPWWLSILSFGLLIPIPQDLDIRLVPWPLLFSKPIDDESELQMGILWNIINGEFGANPDYYTMWMDATGEDEDEWYKLEEDKHGVLSFHLQDLEDNTPLLCALIFSGVLGLLGGVIGIAGAYFGLKHYSNKLWNRMEHMRRYKEIQLTLAKRNRVAHIEDIIKDIMTAKELKSRKGQIPPPFSIPDLAISKHQKAKLNSLAKFLDHVIEQTDSEASSVSSIRLLDIKEKYEAYCFNHEYTEKQLRQNRKMFYKRGFEICSVSDSTTEVFKFIRFKTFRELDESEEIRQFPGESSLSFFIRSTCVISTFESDTIYYRDFISEYEKFNFLHRTANPVPVTKRVMVAMGVDFERKSLNVVKPVAESTAKLDLEKADYAIFAVETNPFENKWWFYDTVAVALHLLLIIFIVAPVLAFVVVRQHFHQMMSVRPAEHFLVAQDVMYRQWLIPEKSEFFPVDVWVAIGFCIIIAILVLAELLCYYLTQQFPFKLENIIFKPIAIRKFTRGMFYTGLFIVCGALGCYIVIGLSWCILGAVLNPQVFLPYAAASSTFITFTLAKVQGALKMFQDILFEIVGILSKMMDKGLGNMLDTIIDNTKNASPGAIGATVASAKYIHELNRSGMGPIIEEMSIDPLMVTAIAKGDPESTVMLAEKFGTDPIIIGALIAGAAYDQKALQESVPRIARIPGVNIDPDVAQSLVMLAWKNNELNQRTAVKTAVIQFGEVMNRKFKGKSDLPEEHQDLDVDPRIIESLVAMTRGEVDRIVMQCTKAEKLGNLPENVCKLFDFLKMFIANDDHFISDLVDLMVKYCGMTKKFSRGLGCLVSEKYHSRLIHDRFKAGKEETQFISFCGQVDAFIKELGIEDSMVIQAIMILARGQKGVLQRLLPKLVEDLNKKLGWKISPENLKSLFTMMLGVNISEERFSDRYGVDVDIIRCFPNLLLCPHVDQLEEKRLETARNYKPAEKPEEEKDPKKKGKKPSAKDLASQKDSDRLMNPGEIELQERNSKQKSSLDELLGDEIQNDREGSDPSQKIEGNPCLDILRYDKRPTGKSMGWLAKQFKLDGNTLMGLFCVLRGAEMQHNKYLNAVTIEVMRRTNLDPKFGKDVTALTQLVCSYDVETIKEAQRMLEMKHRTLTMLAKHFISPKDLPDGTMLSWGYPSTHSLNKQRRELDWENNAKACSDWCKAVAGSIMGQKSRLDMKEKIAIRGQLQMADKLPEQFIKKKMDQICCADEFQLSGIITLLKGFYIKSMTKATQTNAINGLSRIFEVSFNAMKAFVKLALTTSEKPERWKYVEELLDALGMKKEQIEKVDDVYQDSTDQYNNVEKNVANFGAFSKVIGLPSVFLESLTPGLIEKFQNNGKIKTNFIKKFAKEFGLNDPYLQDSLVSFVNQETDGIDKLGSALGLQPIDLPAAVKLFGDSHPEEMIREVGDLMQSIGAKIPVINDAKAFAALIAEYTGEFEIAKEGKGAKRSTAPLILGKKFKIPPKIFEGLLCSLKKDTEGVKKAIMELCNRQLYKFKMDESFCKGLLSMASGQMDGIEDLASEIRYDADIAEVLVLLAGSHSLTHPQLKASTAFKKLCVKIGLDTKKMAAIIAIVKQNVDNAQEICDDLDHNHGFPWKFVKALMSVYYYSTADGSEHPDYDPFVKKTIVKDNIRPLAELFEIKDMTIASFVVGLVQGNAGVIEDVCERFGWSGFQRSIYGSLICLFHQSPFVHKPPQEGIYAWMAYKQLSQIASYVAQLFQLNPEGVEKIIQCARFDPLTMKWLMDVLKLKDIKQTKRLIKMIIYSGEVDSESEEEDEPEEPEVSEDQEDLTKDDDQGSPEGSDDQLLKNDEEEEKEIGYDICLEKFQKLVKKLNKEYPEHAENSEQKPFAGEMVKLLWTLSSGVFDHFEDFEKILTEIYAPAEPPISVAVAKELLALASGNLKNVQALPYVEQADKDPGVEDAEKEEFHEDSLFKLMSMAPNSDQMEFLIKLASRDRTWANIHRKGSDSPQVKKVIRKIKIAKALYALCSLEPMALQDNAPALFEHLELDPAMTQIIVLLSAQALDLGQNGINPLAERLDMDAVTTNCWAVMALGPGAQRNQAINTIVEKLQLPSADPVNAIFTIMSGDLYEGWNHMLGSVCQKGEKDDHRVTIVDKIMTILSGHWKFKVPKIADDIKEGKSSEPKRMDTDSSQKSQSNQPLGNLSESTRYLLAQQLGLDSIKTKNEFLNQMLNSSDISIAEVVMDMVIGIAQSAVHLVPAVMTLYDVEPTKHHLLEHLINLYDMKDSELTISSEQIENYILANSSVTIPAGLLQALYGSIRKFSDVLAHGTSRSLPESGAYMTEDVFDPKILADLPQVLVWIAERQLLHHYKQKHDVVEFVIKKILGLPKIQAIDMEIFLSLISIDLPHFITSICQKTGDDVDSLRELHYLASPTTAEHLEHLPWIRDKITAKFGQVKPEGEESKQAGPPQAPPASQPENAEEEKKGLSEDVVDSLLLVIASKIDDIDVGRHGIGKTLYTLVEYFVKKIEISPNFQELTDAEICQFEATDEVGEDMEQQEVAIVMLLDAFFLACYDPTAHKETILAAMPIYGRVLLGKVPEEAINLISGIVTLFIAEGNQGMERNAIKELAKAFGVRPRVAKGLFGLARGDWNAMEGMVSRLCEFDLNTIKKSISLIKRLKLAKEADDVIETKEEENKLAMFEALKEKIKKGADVEQIFDMLDADGSGAMDFEEFQEALKFYDIKLTVERQRQIFSQYDANGNGTFNVREFNKAIAFLKNDMSTHAMAALGMSKPVIIKGLLGLIFILLLIFAFIFFGIAGFTTGSTLGAVTNTMMPMAGGGVLGGASGSDVEGKIKRIKPAIEEKYFDVL